jgi:CrcB protein
MDIYKLLAVGLGGTLGSVARYITVRAIDQRLNAVFPFGTLAVNIVGSFILGLVYTVALRKTGMNENWRIFLGAGFCGGFTTFSAFAWENLGLLQQKNFGMAVTYIIGSLFLGIIAVLLGVWAGRTL